MNGERILGAANEFEVLQGDWVQLAPFGSFPHARAVQLFQREDAAKIAETLKTQKAGLTRRFGGLPRYEGHPEGAMNAANFGQGPNFAFYGLESGFRGGDTESRSERMQSPCRPLQFDLAGGAQA